MEAPKAIKIYKILLDIAWYLMILVLIFLILGNLISVIKNGEISGFFTLNMEVELPKTDFSKFKNSYNFILEQPAKIFIEIADIKLKSLANPFILFYLFFSLIGIFLIIFQLKLLRNLVKDVIGSKIFTPQNVKRLKSIGYLELLSFALYLLYLFAMPTIIKNYGVLDPSLTYSPNYDLALEHLPRALEYLIFAGIFSFGLKIKQEQDLTI